MDLFKGIIEGLGKIVGLVDDLHTSDEERLSIKTELFELQAALTEKAYDYERSLVEAQARVVEAEAKSEHWLTATWRPITMLSFLVLIYLVALGIADVDALALVPDKLWQLLTMGLGGYVVGRTGEKIAASVLEASKRKEEA